VSPDLPPFLIAIHIAAEPLLVVPLPVLVAPAWCYHLPIAWTLRTRELQTPRHTA
jgi:hypothetical protein